MAKTRIRPCPQRLTWTRFHLPDAKTWPEWSYASSNKHIGPLADIPGVLKVLLGRQVDDSEQAALIILWDSTTSLGAFESSSACDQLLKDLNYEKTTSPASLFALQRYSGFNLAEALHGRITLTILHIQNDNDCPGIVALNRVPFTAFSGFYPAGCEDIRGPPFFQRMAFTWSDQAPEQQQKPLAADSPHIAQCYVFYRWNGNRGTPEREAASAEDPEACMSWVGAVAKATPPVIAWEQQRWQIKTAPCYSEYISEEELEGYPYQPCEGDNFGRLVGDHPLLHV